MRRLVLALCLSLSLGFASSALAAPLDVAVSIPPQKFFVEAIGGDHVHVQVMVRPGYEPATYDPTPRQLAELSQAKLYFAIGAPFERTWLPRFASVNSRMKIVETQRGIERLDPRTGKPGAQPNPHIWLSPPLVRIQAANILRALAAADPAHAAAFRLGYARLITTVDRVDQSLAKQLLGADLGNRRFLVFHPALYYFARCYDLHEITIEQDGKEPGPKALADLIQSAHKDGIKVVFVEPQFSQKAARTIANQIGGHVVAIDPLTEDWPQGMEAIAKALREGMAH